MIDKAELRRLAEGATREGRWRFQADIDWDAGEEPLPDDWGDIHVKYNKTIAHNIAPNNGKFIAAANPSVVLELLDEIEKLREVAEAARNCVASGALYAGTEDALNKLDAIS